MHGTLNVIHVVHSLDCGGLERLVLSLIKAGKGHGQNVSVVCLDRPGLLADDAEQAGASVFCVHKKQGLRLETARQLKAIFRKTQPDVVHTHHIGPLLYAGRAACAMGIPVVVHTEHGHYLKNITPWYRRARTHLLWRFASHYAKQFCCVSPDIAEIAQAIGIDPDKIVIVPNGIDTTARANEAKIAQARQQLGLSIGQSVLGTVGRLSEIKRQDLMLRAFAKVQLRHPQARLLLVGDGPERGALIKLAIALGIQQAVVFCGYQAEPEVYLQLMDAFVLTSRSEGMPMALLEAWAVGKPVVATAVGSIPDLVKNGHDGWVVAFPDVEAIAGAIEHLLSNRPQACRMGQNGQMKVCDRFGLERMAATYDNTYRQSLAQPLKESA